MFHAGDINSGISLAITERKLVACFIYSDVLPAECSTWETWLENHTALLLERCILLRLEFGSRDANFLNAFCPVGTGPALVIIDGGRVLEKMEGSEVGEEEFGRRLRGALGVADVQTDTATGHGSGAAEELQREVEMAQSGQPPQTQEPSEVLHSSEPRDTQPHEEEPESSPNMSNLFPDRAQRMEEEKAKREAANKAERIARANARRKEAEEAHATHTGKGKGKEMTSDAAEKEKARRDWIMQQKKRKDEAKQDRERVLAQIEVDKQNRKARAAEKMLEAQAAPLPPSADAASRRTMGAGGMCSLVVRLFDGSSVKGRFEPSATLGTTVRDWIKETTSLASNSGAADVPFTFKQIQAPKPSRAIEISEEQESLQSLDLTPNATLILVPISTYTDAYSDNGRGYTGTALHAAYGIANTAYGVASYALSFVPGFGGTAASSDQAAAGATPTLQEPLGDPIETGSASSSSVKVKTLADQRVESASKADRSAEFYNGNSSAFEGRKDDDDKK